MGAWGRASCVALRSCPARAHQAPAEQQGACLGVAALPPRPPTPPCPPTPSLCQDNIREEQLLAEVDKVLAQPLYDEDMGRPPARPDLNATAAAPGVMHEQQQQPPPPAAAEAGGTQQEQHPAHTAAPDAAVTGGQGGEDPG